MIKKALILSGVIFGLILITAIGFILALQTRLATPLINKVFELSAHNISVEQANYQFPNHLRLDNIHLNSIKALSESAPKESKPVLINHIELWLSGINWRTQKVAVQDVLIDGLQLTPALAQTDLSAFKIHHLALKNITINEPNLMVQGLSLQISNPKWQQDTPLISLPYGEIQLSAQQVKWHQQTLNNLLLNSHYQMQNSTIKGISFDWQTSHISGQAEQYGQQWSLVNVTLDKLNLSQQQIDQFSHFVENNKSQWQINHINSLDITNSDIHIGHSHFYGLNLSIEDMNLAQWPPEKGSLTLEADSVKWHELQFIEPIADIELTPTDIKVKQLSTEFMQGQLQTSLDITNDKLSINNLSLNGIKWILDKENKIATFNHFLANFNDISLQKVKVTNSQIIQANNTPRWQSSGTYINGSELIIKQGGHWGLWQGKLNLTTNSISIDKFIANQAIIDMQTQQGVWQLKRAFLPLEQGYIKANAQMDLNRISRPWSLTLSTDSLPIAPLLKPLTLPFNLTGMADIDANLSGLSGDTAMLNSSLTGTLQANLHSLILKPVGNQKPLTSSKPVVKPITNVPNIAPVTSQPINTLISETNATLTADRGRITLPEFKIEGNDEEVQLQGKWDMMESSHPHWQLNYRVQNNTTKVDLF